MMSSIGVVDAVLGLQQAQQVGKLQLAVAAKMMEVSAGQEDAALKLIEAAAENLSAASEEFNIALGQLVDFQA